MDILLFTNSGQHVQQRIVVIQDYLFNGFILQGLEGQLQLQRFIMQCAKNNNKGPPK